jgi:tRNA pseudouridine38-40 synthase
LKNYKLIIQYEGTNYSGWQIQKNAPSVQGEIQEAILILLKEKVNLIAAGRTDAGVHAWGQTANFRTEKELDLFKFKHSLNALLPGDISIPKILEVNENFHSRFDALLRSYLYFFSFEKSPFFNSYSSLNKNLKNYDFEKLNEISTLLIGEKDFSSFAKNKSEIKNKICNVQNIRWRKSNGIACVLIEADRFLHGMVRAIVGTLLQAYSKSDPQRFLEKILEEKKREAAGQAVPAKGLFLFKVKYSSS